MLDVKQIFVMKLKNLAWTVSLHGVLFPRPLALLTRWTYYHVPNFVCRTPFILCRASAAGDCVLDVLSGYKIKIIDELVQFVEVRTTLGAFAVDV